MKKIFLTSAITMCMIAPAIAEPSHTSATFPNDELMQEDYTYTNQATYTNTGVYSGNVDADPEFAWTDINVTAGNYLPQNATATTGCTAGNFCPGLQSPVHYDTTQDQGIEPCPSGFTNSATGATANTQCYRACDVANMGANGTITNIAHATTLTGNDYYGAGTDTCVASACENGWSVSSGACVANTININWNGASAEDIATNEAGQCTYGGDIRTPRAFSGTVPTGKHFVGWKFVKPPFDLSTLDYTIDGTAYGYKTPEYTDNTDTYGLTENGTWGVTLSDGTSKVRGEARCSTNSGTFATAGDPGSATTGQYCWCRATGYKADNNSEWQDVVQSSLSWVFYDDWGFAPDCASYCADTCGNGVRRYSDFRRAVYGQSGN